MLCLRCPLPCRPHHDPPSFSSDARLSVLAPSLRQTLYPEPDLFSFQPSSPASTHRQDCNYPSTQIANNTSKPQVVKVDLSGGAKSPRVNRRHYPGLALILPGPQTQCKLKCNIEHCTWFPARIVALVRLQKCNHGRRVTLSLVDVDIAGRAPLLNLQHTSVLEVKST